MEHGKVLGRKGSGARGQGSGVKGQAIGAKEGISSIRSPGSKDIPIPQLITKFLPWQYNNA